MFAYSLSGLQLDNTATTGVTEVEENETTARSAVYQVIASLLAEPDADLVGRALDGRLAKEFEQALELLTVGWAPGEIPTEGLDDIPALAASHRSVIGSGVESLLTERRWVDDADHALADAERSYQYFGLGAPADADVPVDHLTAQFDFMQFVTFKEAAASSPRLAKSFQRAQRDFLGNHLNKWLPAVCSSSELEAASAWSRWVVGLAASFVAADLDHASVS